MRLTYYRDLALLYVLGLSAAFAAPVIVKQPQGATHGFLTVRSEGGFFLGTGELTQVAVGNRMKAKLTLSFRDGSIDDETVVYTQAGSFRLIEDHHIQKGPAFADPIDMTVDGVRGTVTMRSKDKNGSVKSTTEQMDLPNDLANGMIGTLLLNTPRNSPGAEWHMVAPTGKGRLVKIQVTSASESAFKIAGTAKRASIFRLHADIGGIAGVVAPSSGRSRKTSMFGCLRAMHRPSCA